MITPTRLYKFLYILDHEFKNSLLVLKVYFYYKDEKKYI